MRRFPPHQLQDVGEEIFTQLGALPPAAQDVTESLIDADLKGHHSHGIRLAPRYAEYIRQGRINIEAGPRVTESTDTKAIISGEDALGQLVGREAIKHGVNKAKNSGFSVISIRRATHLGRIGEWAEKAANEGFTFLAFVNNPTSRLAVPAGGSEAKLSTNPVAVGYPSFSVLPFPIVLDIATSQVAFGKIRHRKSKEQPIPDEWIADTSSTQGQAPGLLPLGGTTSGYKGTGLAVICELLAGSLSNGYVAGEDDAPFGNQAIFIFIDITDFTSKSRIEQRISALRSHIEGDHSHSEQDVGAAAGGNQFVLPGRREYETQIKNNSEGIPVAENDVEKIKKTTQRLGISTSL